MPSPHPIDRTKHLSLLMMLGTGPAMLSCQGDALAPPRADEPDEPDALTEPSEPTEPTERQKLARSGRHLYDPSAGAAATPATANDLTAALDITPEFLMGATLQGPDVSSSVLDGGWGVVGPRWGNSFAVLSTGVIGTIPEPGTDMGAGNADGDIVTLEINLDVPEGFTRLSFDYNFVSAESPDFVGSLYNDRFTATLIEPGGITNEVAEASVNSSFFFDASTERAGGTMFDIFASSPNGVDTVFDGNLPDAGITDFQSVSVELPTPGSYTLVFEISDQGDGLLDSAVMLDNLRIHAMERLSLNPLPPPPPAVFTEPQLVQEDGAISQDPALLRQASERVRGATADGATQVLLRTRVPSAGTVQYSVDSGTLLDDGGVRALHAEFASTTVTVDAVEDMGEFWTFAIYTVPDDFDRGGDEDLLDRTIQLSASFVPDDPALSGFVDTQEFLLQRPPIVLVHGLWDSPIVWKIPLADDPRFLVRYAGDDDNITETSLTDHLQTVPANAILSARYQLQDDAIASAAVDVVAHGTGGLLARQHIGRIGYEGANNFGRGDVHKLITINTPHLGSDLAVALMEMWDAWDMDTRAQMDFVFSIQGIDLNGGAVEDIQVGSSFISTLPATSVPSHAVVGEGGRFIPRNDGDLRPASFAVGQRNTLYITLEQQHPSMPFDTPQSERQAFIFGDQSEVFTEDHDMFASVSSQIGGIVPTSAASSFTSTYDPLLPPSSAYFDPVHFNVPRGDGGNHHSNWLTELLHESIDAPQFDTFPAPSDLMQQAAALPPADPSATTPVSFSIVANGLTITSPLDGDQVVPGSTLQVSIEADPGIDANMLGLVTQSASAILDAPSFPLVVDLLIPENSPPALDLLAFGFNPAGDLLISEPIQLGATPEGELLHVHLLDRNPFLFGMGDTQLVNVLGLYDDGIERNIASSAAGTTYTSSDPTIFTVTPEGVLEATGPGRATLVARNGMVMDSVTVDVRPTSFVGFDLIVTWPGGHCASVLVSNNMNAPTTDWEITLDLGTATITDHWLGLFSSDTGIITVGPESEVQAAIPAGTTKDYMGFCAVDPELPAELPTVVDMTATY